MARHQKRGKSGISGEVDLRANEHAVKKEFTLPEVVRITGVKRDRLKEWMYGGYIKPSIREASGIGTRNIFSWEDLCRICLFGKLVEIGFSRRLAGQVLQAAKREWKA